LYLWFISNALMDFTIYTWFVILRWLFMLRMTIVTMTIISSIVVSINSGSVTLLRLPIIIFISHILLISSCLPIKSTHIQISIRWLYSLCFYLKWYKNMILILTRILYGIWWFCCYRFLGKWVLMLVNMIVLLLLTIYNRL
jgi:hypothetical protein